MIWIMVILPNIGRRLKLFIRKSGHSHLPGYDNASNRIDVAYSHYKTIHKSTHPNQSRTKQSRAGRHALTSPFPIPIFLNPLLHHASIDPTIYGNQEKAIVARDPLMLSIAFRVRKTFLSTTTKIIWE
jgi:hypothetical protein